MRFVMLFFLCALTLTAAGQAPVSPKVKARAALLMNADTGEILRQRNPDLRLPPASLTKIMTAYLLSRSLPPDSPVTASANAARTPGTTLGMKPGDTYSARDLLHAMLLVSANDASVASAEAMEGDAPAFVARMNAEAQSIGAVNTHFANPDGLPDPAHYATARDLALMTKKTLENPAFAAAARARTYPIAADNGNPPQILTNTNTLLPSHPEITGVKTGWTREAGHCFVGAATKGGRHYITVVLNSPDWQADTLALLQDGASDAPSGIGATVAPASAPVSPSHSAAPDKPFRFPSLSACAAPLIFALLGLAALFLLRGIFMSKFRFPFAGARKAAAPPASDSFLLPAPSAGDADLSFTLFPGLAALARGSAVEWLDALFANPPRLMEPHTRRRAAALLDARPNYDRTALLALLDSQPPNLQVPAAELLHPFAPQQAEAILTDIADDPQHLAFVRSEAFRVLSETGGNRHEVLFRQTVLREGFPAAALSLRRLPRLTDETQRALGQALKANGDSRHLDLRGASQKVVIACILAEHGALPLTEAAEHIQTVPTAQRDALLTEILENPRSDWAVSQITEIALRGQSGGALESLLSADPEQVRAALETKRRTADGPTQARILALEWLLFQTGDGETVHKMAEEGDDTARNVRRLSLSHHADPAAAPPEVALAAAQIVSLRLGFGRCSAEMVAALFRTSASGEPDAETLAQNPELEPLARAYAHPAAHQAAQNALQSPDGPEILAAELVRGANHPACQSEMGFWADKTERGTRLPLVRALGAAQTEAARQIVAERAEDSCPQIRKIGLRMKAQSGPVTPKIAPDVENIPASFNAAA